MSGLLASEGGYQEFVLRGGEWVVLFASASSGDHRHPRRLRSRSERPGAGRGLAECARSRRAIQVGAAAYLRRQFKTIAVILVPLAAIVFLTSTKIVKPNGDIAPPTFAQAGFWRTVAFIAGCVASGLTGYIGMTLATRGNVRTAAAAPDEQHAAR